MCFFKSKREENVLISISSLDYTFLPLTTGVIFCSIFPDFLFIYLHHCIELYTYYLVFAPNTVIILFALFSVWLPMSVMFPKRPSVPYSYHHSQNYKKSTL